MSEFDNIKKDILESAKKMGQSRTSGYDTTATVTRIEGSTAWIHIPGGVIETPAQLTISAKEGDAVQVRVAGGSAWITGNATAPPTDDAKAIAATAIATGAEKAAEVAYTAAEAAQESAAIAAEAADEAMASATTANTAANGALTQLSVVEDVVGVLTWISQHGVYTASTDTEVMPGKFYFTRSGSAGSYTYTVVTNPTGNPSTQGYYELTNVDEAVSNYIASHLALTDAGLWVIKDNQGYKSLMANDGMKVYDASGNLVATFGESITFSSSRPQYIGNSTAYLSFTPNSNTLEMHGKVYAAAGEIGGFTIDGTRLYSPVTIGTKTYRANIQSMGNETDPARLAFYVAIDENGSSTYPFRVNYAGTLFTSDVQATGGKIGPWTIGSTAIYNTLTSMADSAHDGTYIGTDGIRMVSGGQTVSNSLVANSTWSYVESANDVVGIRMVAWPDGSTGLYEYDIIGGTLSTLWLRSGNSLSTDYNVWVGSDVDSYVNILKNGTIALSKTNGGGRIEFCYAGTIPATSYLYEESSNHLYTNAYLRTKLYNGTVGQVIGSVPTDGNQIAYFSSNSTTLFINGQHGTTGSTFSNKSIAFSTSDIRLKDNIEDSKVEALPIVNRMKVREFDWTDDREDKHQSIGVVADELEEIDPKLAVGGGYDADGHMDVKSVDNFYLTGYLLKAVQELSAKVDALEAEVKRLKGVM